MVECFSLKLGTPQDHLQHRGDYFRQVQQFTV